MTEEARQQDPIPAKVAGEHRWVVMAVYSVTEHQAAALERGAIVNMGTRIDSTVGCYDCGRHWLAAKGTPCEAAAK